MQPELKFSRFMFHLKFSNKSDYVHDHELYELMKSRNLYQTQFGLRSNYQKMMRNLAKDEKQSRYNFENNRKIFVQKMKERREQVDKLRNRMSASINSLSKLDDSQRPEKRQYVNLPRSTIVYTDFPALDPNDAESQAPNYEISSAPDNTTLIPAALSPSMVATNFSGPIARFQPKDENTSLDGAAEKSVIAKYLVVSKNSPRIKTAKGECPKFSTRYERSETTSLMEEKDLIKELASLAVDMNNNKDGETSKDDEFETKTKLGEGKAHESTVYFPDDYPPKCKFKQQLLASQSKAKEWAEKHGIQRSRSHILKDKDFQRLMIDRPSKWALDLVHQDRDDLQSKILDVRLQFNRKQFEDNIRRKARKLDSLSQKLAIKQRISLPELDTTPKPMVTLNPGGTTPDGRLILTKADYEDYLSNYRKARKCRLEQSKKRSTYLSKQIESFSVEPKLCLRDETSLRASLKTI